MKITLLPMNGTPVCRRITTLRSNRNGAAENDIFSSRVKCTTPSAIRNHNVVNFKEKPFPLGQASSLLNIAPNMIGCIIAFTMREFVDYIGHCKQLERLLSTLKR